MTPSRITTLIATLFLSLLAASVQAGQWTTGYCTTQQGQAVNAVPAQCPASFPQRCDNIGQTNWCCPSGTYCGWTGSNGQVGCCPWGDSCTNAPAAGAYNPPPTTTYHNPAQTVVPPATTVYVAGGGEQCCAGCNCGNNGVYTTQNVGQPQYGGNNVGYCSTLYFQGNSLPTTAQGRCGTILILPAGATGLHVGIREWGVVIGGLVLGVHLLVGRWLWR